MNYNYKVNIRPQHERQKSLNELLNSTSRTFTSYDVFEGKPEILKVVTLPLHFPIYRMSNGRTQTHQLAYISEKGSDPDFFSLGEENASVQQIQHDILKIFAHEGTETITPIIDELERAKQQTEPLLITPAGIVVNGNRRLAAMRELYHAHPDDFSVFKNVECAVLPPLDIQQIDDIEIRLQMTPETKLPYSWIDESLKIKKQILAGRKEEEIARLMRKKPVEIKKSLSALNYADMYLKEWKKRPFDYSLVEAGEQFFYDLVSSLKGKENQLLEANIRMAWILFDNRTNLGSRIYSFNKILGEKAQDVLSNLSERLEIDTSPENENTPEFDSEFELQNNEDSYQPLISIFEDSSRQDEVFDELRAVCQTILDSAKTAKEGKSALSAVQDAHTRLLEVDLTKADSNTYKGIDRQLQEILNKAAELREKLKEYLKSIIV
ncbi:MAG: hypothetical protein CVV49_13860 [Spirochaetae bacterium HGW-Spirochaetae-5]|nr:MAG: hypothetical protein CVV49_13860 [Spirochaetae bacterium HGW-Spirochaetae-5]